jgi:hypothetical protein
LGCAHKIRVTEAESFQLPLHQRGRAAKPRARTVRVQQTRRGQTRRGLALGLVTYAGKSAVGGVRWGADWRSVVVT